MCFLVGRIKNKIANLEYHWSAVDFCHSNMLPWCEALVCTGLSPGPSCVCMSARVKVQLEAFVNYWWRLLHSKTLMAGTDPTISLKPVIMYYSVSKKNFLWGGGRGDNICLLKFHISFSILKTNTLLKLCYLYLIVLDQIMWLLVSILRTVHQEAPNKIEIYSRIFK